MRDRIELRGERFIQRTEYKCKKLRIMLFVSYYCEFKTSVDNKEFNEYFRKHTFYSQCEENPEVDRSHSSSHRVLRVAGSLSTGPPSVGKNNSFFLRNLPWYSRQGSENETETDCVLHLEPDCCGCKLNRSDHVHPWQNSWCRDKGIWRSFRKPLLNVQSSR